MAQQLAYTQCGDYYIPDIKLAYTGTQTLGKYGRMRRVFLEQNKPMLFNDMVLSETLFQHLWEVQQTCEKRMELLMEGIVVKESSSRQVNAAVCMGGTYEQPESAGGRNHPP